MNTNLGIASLKGHFYYVPIIIVKFFDGTKELESLCPLFFKLVKTDCLFNCDFRKKVLKREIVFYRTRVSVS